MRTHMCGELRAEHEGQVVSVCGWVGRRREHGEHLAFIDLRDHTGVVQCVVDGAADLRSEFVVRITGTVRARPEGTTNDALATGAVEVGDCAVEILSVAAPPPFPIDERADGVDELIRLRYRYLDLRRERMQRNLRIRADRELRHPRGDGAPGLRRGRDADADAVHPGGRPRVPRAVAPGARQLLRAPAVAPAVQAAADGRRHRPLLPDRPLPARRGPAGRPPVRVHAARRRGELRHPGRGARVHLRGGARRRRGGARASDPGEIPQITWHEAMDRYGVDKPDLRFGMELVELTEVFAATEFKAFASAGAIKGLRVAGAAADYGRNKLDGLTDRAKALGRQGPRVDAGRRGRRARQPRRQVPVRRRSRRRWSPPWRAEAGDLLLLVADEWMTTCEVLGHAAQRPRAAAGARGPVPLRVGRRLPDVRGPRRRRAPEDGPPPVHPPARRRPRPARVRPDVGALEGVRPRAQRLGARLRLDPDPRARAAAADLRPARHRRGGGAAPLRLLPHAVRLRRAAPRRLRLRHRPPRRDPRRRGEHPRGHRLPEAPVRRRPHDPGPHPGRRPPAPRPRPPPPPPQALTTSVDDFARHAGVSVHRRRGQAAVEAVDRLSDRLGDHAPGA